MGSVRHPLLAEQHDAEEGSLQKKCRQHLVPKQGTGNVARTLHKAGPVGAELKTHGNTRYHAQSKGQGVNLDPKVIGMLPVHVAGLGVTHAEEQQEPAQPDRNSRKQDVKCDVGRKLNAGQYKRIKFHGAPIFNGRELYGTCPRTDDSTPCFFVMTHIRPIYGFFVG